MAHASIPVDLFNPGQVFACLGFLEAADVLLGDAEGCFDWGSEADVCFRLHAGGDKNPFGTVLRFLVEAQVQRIAPNGYADPSPKNKRTSVKKSETRTPDDVLEEDAAEDGPLLISDSYPGAEPDWRALPVRLETGGRHLDIGHWADRSSRNDFKLFAGQQRGPAIASAMLGGVTLLWKSREFDLLRDPFGITTEMGGSSFKFDVRKSWTALDAGYSPDEQGDRIMASPVVEILAAAGLQHARPDEFETRRVRYGVWGDHLPPSLARPALGGVDVGILRRTFQFTLALAGKNKIITSAEEERNQ